MFCSNEIIDVKLLNREIRNVHLVKPLKNKFGPYRVLDVDVTPDYKELKSYVERAKKFYGMTGKIRDPFFKIKGRWWIELKDREAYSEPMIGTLKQTLYAQLRTDEIDGNILEGDVAVKLIKWKFGDRQGFSWKMTDFYFRSIKEIILKESQETPKIQF